jgi:TRAP-type C4-dicarboxylate transport system permease small subunit
MTSPDDFHAAPADGPAILRCLSVLHAALERMSRWGAWVGGAAFTTVSIMVLLEVVGREFFGMRSAGSGEIAGYVFAVVTAWGFSYALFERAHIRIDFAYQKFGERLRGMTDLAGLLGMFLFSIVLADKAFDTVIESIEYDAVSTTSLQISLWVPQLLWAIGMIYFSISVLGMFLYALVLRMYGRRQEAHRVAGIPSAVE